jgi:type III pantothenate kinase
LKVGADGNARAATLSRGFAIPAAYDRRQMLIAIDVGNTSTTIGRLEGTEVGATRRAATDARATVDELRLLIDGLLAIDGSRLADVHEIVAASVVPAASATLEELALRLEIRTTFASADTIPLPVRVERPAEVGADRLANALAALRLHGAPAIVVDFGTATTFDSVSDKGAYIGGAIAPGIGISLEALGQRGAQLRKIELARPRSVIGKNTVEALQSGALYGFAGQVDGTVRRMQVELSEHPDEVTVIATGGLAPALLGEAETIHHHEPWLTLIGLGLVWDRNRT